MPKFVLEWYVEMQGEYTIEAADEYEAALKWDEVTYSQRFEQSFEITDSDLMNVREEK